MLLHGGFNEKIIISRGQKSRPSVRFWGFGIRPDGLKKIRVLTRSGGGKKFLGGIFRLRKIYRTGPRQPSPPRLVFCVSGPKILANTFFFFFWILRKFFKIFLVFRLRKKVIRRTEDFLAEIFVPCIFFTYSQGGNAKPNMI